MMAASPTKEKGPHPMRILVTGGAGFIGSHLTAATLARGHHAVVLDDLSTGHLRNLEAIGGDIKFIKGSLLDPAALDAALDGVDAVFHQAAMPSVPASIEDPIGTHAVNATGTLELLEACRRHGVRRVIYAASSSAYGDHDVAAASEDLIPRPKSPYAVQKLAGEHYCHTYHALHGLETIALRYFNVFGPRQDPASQYAAVIPAFITRMQRGERPTIYGDGAQSRDFTFIDNVVDINFAALAAPAGACGRTYNAACGRSIDLVTLVALINKALGTDLAPRHTPPRAGDIVRSQADMTAAAAALGYTARVPVEDGLRRTVEWFSRG